MSPLPDDRAAAVPAASEPASSACTAPAGPGVAPAAAPASGCAGDCVRIHPSEMRAGLGAGEVRRELRRASRHTDTGRRLLAFYLVEMEQRRLYQASGHGSTAYYAEVQLELDRRRTAELLRVGAKLLELREVDRAFCEGRLGWAKVLIVARMATPEHEAVWLKRALELDVRALALLAARSREGGPPRTAGDEKGLPEIRFPVSGSLSPLVYAKLEQAQRRLGDELGRAVTFVGLLDTLLDQFLATLPTDNAATDNAATDNAATDNAAADGNPPSRKRVDASIYRVELYESGKRGDPLLVMTEDGPMPVDGGGPGLAGAMSEAVRCDAGVRNHHVAGSCNGGAHEHAHDHRARDIKTPPSMRRRVFRRDGHRCRSCRSRYSLHAHHKEFRGHGGRTLVHNLITLCTRCHGLVHAGLLVIEGESVDVAHFVDAQGHPLTSPEAIAALELATLKPPAPVEASSAGASTTPGPDAGLVTLARVPGKVDAAWWRRHAHLVRDRGENGLLCFVAGTPAEAQAESPVEAPAPEVGAPAPAAEAFAGLVGQEERILRFKATAAGARARGKSFPHVLLSGPPGTGKTTLARGIAALIQQPLAEVSAPLMRDRATLVRLLAGLSEGSVLLLDEAHALPLALLEVLLEAMAEGRLSLVLSDGVTARNVTLRLPTFTLVAATTDEGAISAALRSRFGLREPLVHYGEEALAELVRVEAAKAGVEATPEGARGLAKAARGTPREAHRLLERALEDVALAGAVHVDADIVERTLARVGYDAEGLDPREQQYLAVLRASPTPMPLSRLARTLGSTQSTLVEHVEPWLFQRGLVRMTPGGRTAGSYARLVGVAVDGRPGAPNVWRSAGRAYRTS